MIFKRKFLSLTSLLICVCVIAAITSSEKTSLPTSLKVVTMPQIILDAGHGESANTTKTILLSSIKGWFI